MVSPTYKEIIRSINELDEIGLEHFLEKYNFRPNIKYALIYNEKPYPPKALWFRALEREYSAAIIFPELSGLFIAVVI